jgi:hypothetical protein
LQQKITAWAKSVTNKEFKQYGNKSYFLINVDINSNGMYVDWINLKGYPCITHILRENIDPGDDVTTLNYTNAKVIGNLVEHKDLVKGLIGK